MSAGSRGDVPGADADKPAGIPPRGWYRIARRIVHQLGRDHVQLVAAGVAFYAFLAIFPALSAIVSFYGLMMSPAQVQSQMNAFAGILPGQARDLLSNVLVNLVSRSDGTLGWSLLVSILLSLWSAKKGTNALFQGLNIVYNEVDTRPFIKRTALTLLFTVSGFLAAGLCLFLIVGISIVIESVRLPLVVEFLVSLIRWPILAGLFIFGLTMAYKYAPHRDNPKVRWITVGSLTSTGVWLVLSYAFAAFAAYVGNFSSFDETYGSLAAVVILLLWLYLTALAILLGAEINAEMEHQTAQDTTVGPAQPMGERGAWYADHLAEK
jgi:membrane protein